MYLMLDERTVSVWGLSQSKTKKKYNEEINKGTKVEMRVMRKEGKI